MDLLRANSISRVDFSIMAVALYKIWKDKPVRQSPPTPEALMASLLAEKAAGNHLDFLGYWNVQLNGLTASSKTIEFGKPYEDRRADITATGFDAKRKSIEVKSGRPDKFLHRQFTLSHIQQYKKKGIDLVVWVDVYEDLSTEVFQVLTLDEIEALPIKFNSFDVKCYTLTGGYVSESEQKRKVRVAESKKRVKI